MKLRPEYFDCEGHRACLRDAHSLRDCSMTARRSARLRAGQNYLRLVEQEIGIGCHLARLLTLPFL